MQIYLKGSSYASLYKRHDVDDDVVLNKDQRYKAIYEMKKENGYLRHYVTKANGDKVMIRETKLPKCQEHEQTSGEMSGRVTEMVLNQLTKPFHKEQFEQFSKTGIFAQKEKQLEKYKTSI